MSNLNLPPKQALEQERNEILQQFEDWLELPMLTLSFAWLALFIIELVWGLSPFLQTLSTTIWIIFILDFGVELILAPQKRLYLKRNWLTAFSLALPALRIFRIVRVIRVLRTAQAVRGLRLLRVMTRVNRGMRSLSASVNRRGFSYVVGLTAIVMLIGSAGIYAFEYQVSDASGLNSYADALWWTAMLLTTLGSDYFPKTPEGRVLCFILALYAFAVFGYITATLASFFIGQDAASDEAELAGTRSLEALRTEIAALRAEIRALSHNN